MTTEEETPAPTCFIIGPIGDRLAALGTAAKQNYEDATQMWEEVFEPACNEFGLTPVRADKISDTGEIPEQIFVLLRDADIVIADVTGGNANVMYELGMRHTRNKITVQIGEHSRLPFDINTIRTIQFRRTEAGLIDARNNLVESLRTALSTGGGQVTATRVWGEIERHIAPEDLATAAARSRTSDDPLDDETDEFVGPGLIDQMATGEAAIEGLTGTLQEIMELVQLSGEVSAKMTPNTTTSTSFAKRLQIMKEWADALDEPASSLDEVSDRYFEQVNDVDVMVKIVVDRIASGEEGIEDARSGLAAIASLSSSVEEANVGIAQMVKSVRDLRKLASVLRETSKSLERSLNRVLSANGIIATWRDLIEGLEGWQQEEIEQEEEGK